MVTWDASADLVIVGSGGGGLVAALAAAELGLEPLILEKQAFVGGSTAMSGGVIWMPNNPLMRAEGVPDSHALGRAYLDDVVGDAGLCSTPERREAFLTEGSAMISFLQAQGVRLARCPGYSDYYPDRKGGNAAGRAIESVPWDSHELGDWHDKINPGMTRGIGLVVTTNEIRNLPAFLRSPRCFAVSAKVFFRTLISKRRGQDLLANGMALIGQLTKLVRDRNISLRFNIGVEQLLLENGRVVGVRAIREDKPFLIEARKGVLLSAGGFERNAEMRHKYSRQPNEAEWSYGNLGNTGEVLEAAIAVGAKTDLLDEAWWNPKPIPELDGTTMANARQYPRTILVNKAGERFCNESNSYVEVGIAMYTHDAVPAWLIFDDGFRRRYPHTRGLKGKHWLLRLVPGRMPKEWVTNGWIKKSGTVEGLARQIGVDPETLGSTIQRFNRNAVRGEDPEFGRGVGAYNRCLGDPGDKTNPAVGPLDKAPYYATPLYPGDVGTCGGVLTNELGQVLGENDLPIEGLYATGNITATVHGRTYPGAGASIANTMTFGYVAARHVAGRSTANSPA